LGIAAARQPLLTLLRVVPLALLALMVPSYLLRAYFAPAFGNPAYGGIAVEEAERMLSELAVRGHLEVSLEHGGIPYAFGSATLPHKGCGSSTG
jgi:hypothetical protein